MEENTRLNLSLVSCENDDLNLMNCFDFDSKEGGDPYEQHNGQNGELNWNSGVRRVEEGRSGE